MNYEWDIDFIIQIVLKLAMILMTKAMNIWSEPVL